MPVRLSRVLLLITLGCILLGSAATVQAKGVPVDRFLNPDGTLRLEGDFSGTLDLAGYGVHLDPERGPILGPAPSGNNAPLATPLGNWAAIGDGGGNIDETVWAIAISGTDAYVGGSFIDAANISEADYIAKWDGTNWSALSSNGAGDGALNATIYAIAVSGTNVYVGGYFTNVSNSGSVLGAGDYVAKWDGTNWSALGSNGGGNGSLGSTVFAVAISGTDLYVGGTFTNVNNNGSVLTAADRIARWDGVNWSALGSNGSGEGSLNNVVNAIAVSGSNIYVGGQFTDVNNGGPVLGAADYIVQWDGTNWSALGNNGAGGGVLNSTVYALAKDAGGSIYAGGSFSNITSGGVVLGTADFIAKWDGANWSALGNNGYGNGSLDGTVYAILVSGTNVYVGGNYTNVLNGSTVLSTADYIAKWDGTNWSALGNNGAGNGAIPGKSSPSIKVLAMLGSNLLVGGMFYDVNNASTTLPQADFIARWDGTNWASLGTNTNGALVGGTDRPLVKAIAIIGTNLYIGGRFVDVSNHGVNIPEADFIAKWDGANWSALGSNGAGNGALSRSVYALAVSGTNLYVGGDFSNANSGAADYIAQWDGTNWSALGNNGAGNGSLNNVVYGIAVSGTDIYVGGAFTDVNNGGAVLGTADYVVKWDGTNWSALGNNGAGDGALDHTVNALAMSGTDLYVGGYFANAANLPAADLIAKWNGTNWSALGSNGAGNGSFVDGSIYAIAVNGSNVYVGGVFGNIFNGSTVLHTADYVAKWDGTNWSGLGNNGAGNGALNNVVNGIAVNGSDVYVAGNFTDVNNGGTVLPAADYVARWDGSEWSALGTPGQLAGSLNASANVLAVNGPNLLVGGYFTNVRNSGVTPIPEADILAAYGLPGIPSFLPLIRR